MSRIPWYQEVVWKDKTTTGVTNILTNKRGNFLIKETLVLHWWQSSDKGLMLNLSALELLTVANLHYQLS